MSPGRTNLFPIPNQKSTWYPPSRPRRVKYGPGLPSLAASRGWYSYDLARQLADRPSAARIIPEFQQLKIDDLVAAVPNGSFGFPVAALQENEYLAWRAPSTPPSASPAIRTTQPEGLLSSGDQTFVSTVWTITPPGCSFRMRIGWNPSRIEFDRQPGSGRAGFFRNGRKMLRKVKRLSEGLARQAT